MAWPRIGALLVAAFSLVTLASCGYNTIPTLEEQAKAKWADVQNNYQRRADLIPNLVATVRGLRQAGEGRADLRRRGARQGDPGAGRRLQLTDPEKMKQFQDAQNQLSAARSAG